MARDTGASALARRYAALIDRAERVAEELAALRPEDESQAAAIARLRSLVEAQQVASDLGPKLLAALAALAMTPASRAAGGKGGRSDVASGPADALARLRAERGAAR